MSFYRGESIDVNNGWVKKDNEWREKRPQMPKLGEYAG